MGMVAVSQSLISDGDCAACAFRNVLASHFGMDAASKAALGAVHGEETAHFGQNAIEGARLVAIASLDDISVHRVAGPDDRMAFALNGADASGQPRFDQHGRASGRERGWQYVEMSRCAVSLKKTK